MGIFSFIIDKLGKAYDRGKFCFHDEYKVRSFFKGIETYKMTSDVFPEIPYEIENACNYLKEWCDKVPRIRNIPKYIEIFALRKQFEDEKLIHNQKINELIYKKRSLDFNINTFKEYPIKYGKKYYLKNSNFIDKINQYKFLKGELRKFIDENIECKKIYEGVIKYVKDENLRINESLNHYEILKFNKEYNAYLKDMTEYLQINGETSNKDYILALDAYKEINKKLLTHNKDIKKIGDELDNITFSLESVLKNPHSFEYSKLDDYSSLVNKLNSYINIPKEAKTLCDEYEILKDDYDVILESFDLKVEAKKLIERIKSRYDKYLDVDEKEAILREANELKERFESLKADYYTIEELNEVEPLLKDHNFNYVSKHLNDEIFDDVNGKSLDKEQRYSVLCDEVSELTVAGAGSGKTLTICGKVKHLINDLHVKKEDILLLSYSKNSADDLDKKVRGITTGLKVSTFHALGLDILNQVKNFKQNIRDQNLEHIVNEYFREAMYERPDAVRNILTYYSLFLSNNADKNNKYYECEGDLYEDLKKDDFSTIKKQLINLTNNKDKKETIKREHVKSYEEMVIANFYFIMGIRYEYEMPYKEANTATIDKRQYNPDFYLRDYGIYHEHYGINRDGVPHQYVGEERQKYIDSMEWKRKIHEENNTKCIETYSYQFDDLTIFKELEKQLKSLGVEFKPLSPEQIKKSLQAIYEEKYFESFIKLISTFIGLYKARYRNNNEFENMKRVKMHSSYQNYRAKLFLTICKDIYDYYYEKLRKEEKIDFDDMILMAKDELKNIDDHRYKYIIVDEFQDISFSRMEFLQSLIKHGKSKIFAVGDDWQAIYRFSGCDLNIFLKFEDYFRSPQVNSISTTHRNAAEIQTIVEPFITKNPEQYKKHLVANLHIKDPIRLLYYDEDKLSAFYGILSEINKLNPNAKVLILGRNNKDFELMTQHSSELMKHSNGKVDCELYPTMELTYKTVHASKGLESEYVILINAENSKYGFPNKIEDDKLLSLVLSDTNAFEYAEERRLWYVALTRTKLLTYILVDVDKPSEFIEEIKDNCLVMNPELIKVEANPLMCPKCKSGHLVIRKNSQTNKEFFGCSNYPFCQYTNNNVSAVKKRKICPVCGDYMKVIKTKYGLRYRCTNKYCNHFERLESDPRNTNYNGYSKYRNN